MQNLISLCTWLLLLMLLAFVLRCVCLGSSPIWQDEAHSLSVSEAGTPPVNLPEIWRALSSDVHPPLYFWLLSCWRALFGEGIIAARLLSVCWAAALVPALYFLGRIMKVGRRGSLYAAALATFTPYTLYYAQEVRMYTQLATLTALFLGLSGFLILQSVQSRRISRRSQVMFSLAWICCGCALIYTHNFSVFVMAAAVVWGLIVGLIYGRWRPVGWMMLGISFLLLLGSPQLFRLFHGFSEGGGIDWLPKVVGKVDWSWPGLIADRMLCGPMLLRISSPLRSFMAMFALLLIIIGATGGRADVLRLPPARRYVIIRRSLPAVILFLLVGMPLLISALSKPILYEGHRYLIFAVPSLLLALAAGLEKVSRLAQSSFCALLFSVWLNYYWIFFTGHHH